MFHRIDMYLVHVCNIIHFIPDQMFPKAPLPDATFFPLPSYPWLKFSSGKWFLKSGFDQAPSQGKVAVAVRQLHYAMHMIRQYNPTMDVEGVSVFHFTDSLSQRINMQDSRLLFFLCHKLTVKKPGSSRTMGSVVIRHCVVFLYIVYGATRSAIAPYACWYTY